MSRLLDASDSLHTERDRWITLAVLCLAVLMVGINATLVDVALPSIRADLEFSDSSLVWVVNAYLVSFGGILLLGGRLGDIYGPRRVLLVGTLLFTLASLCCGLARSAGWLVAARSAQGVGAAVVCAVALAAITNVFAEPAKRARALGIYVFVNAAGASLGHLLGGILTRALGWPWIFLLNVLVGVVVFALCTAHLRSRERASSHRTLDIAGAITITTSLMLGVYGIVSGNEAGWTSGQTLGVFATAVALLVLFVALEATIESPLIPLQVLRMRNLAVASTVGVLFLAALLTWRFISSLYLQRILGFSALEVAMVLIPVNIIIAVMSVTVTPMLTLRLGVRLSVLLGMLAVSAALALLGRASVAGSVGLDVLPATVLLGVGAGVAYNPLYLSALSSVAQEESGAASGIVTTSFTLGAALGLSVLVGISTARTDVLIASGAESLAALNGGYQVAFHVAALFAATAALVGALFLQSEQHAQGAGLRLSAKPVISKQRRQ